VLGLAAVALLASAMPTLADVATPPVNTESGRFGAYSLADTEGNPGGKCIYGITYNETYYNYLRRIRVHAPVAYARHGKTTQKIAWRLIVQLWTGSKWMRETKSTWVTKSATPTQPAAFSPRGLNFNSVENTSALGPYRARIELRWYAGDDSTVVGTVVLFPHWYLAHEGSTTEYTLTDDCGTTTG
jgi:hypothetical protein